LLLLLKSVWNIVDLPEGGERDDRHYLQILRLITCGVVQKDSPRN